MFTGRTVCSTGVPVLCCHLSLSLLIPSDHFGGEGLHNLLWLRQFWQICQSQSFSLNAFTWNGLVWGFWGFVCKTLSDRQLLTKLGSFFIHFIFWLDIHQNKGGKRKGLRSELSLLISYLCPLSFILGVITQLTAFGLVGWLKDVAWQLNDLAASNSTPAPLFLIIISSIYL